MCLQEILFLPGRFIFLNKLDNPLGSFCFVNFALFSSEQEKWKNIWRLWNASDLALKANLSVCEHTGMEVYVL